MAAMDELRLGQRVLHRAGGRTRPCTIVKKLDRDSHMGTRIRVLFHNLRPQEIGPQTVQIDNISLPLACSGADCSCIAAWPCHPTCPGPPAAGGLCAHCQAGDPRPPAGGEPNRAHPAPAPPGPPAAPIRPTPRRSAAPRAKPAAAPSPHAIPPALDPRDSVDEELWLRFLAGYGPADSPIYSFLLALRQAWETGRAPGHVPLPCLSPPPDPPVRMTKAVGAALRVVVAAHLAPSRYSAARCGDCARTVVPGRRYCAAHTPLLSRPFGEQPPQYAEQARLFYAQAIEADTLAPSPLTRAWRAQAQNWFAAFALQSGSVRRGSRVRPAAGPTAAGDQDSTRRGGLPPQRDDSRE